MEWIVVLKTGTIFKVTSAENHTETIRKWLKNNTQLGDRDIEGFSYYALPKQDGIVNMFHDLKLMRIDLPKH